tara:strand:- start:167 stop:928 length:762 start_codon:yes stop_codon:yes gene_type:complete
MGIFKNFTKTLKKAAPIIGAGIGMYFGGPMGASIGSGIGSLAAGQDTEQALLNAALAGGTAYMSGYGKGFEKLPSGGMSSISGPEMMMNQTTTTPVSAIQEAGGSGVLSQIGNFVKDNKALTAGIAGLGLAGLASEEEQKTGEKMRDYPVGKTRLGYGRIGDKMYNLDDEDERRQYFEDNRNRQNDEDDVGILAAAGGEVKGPGTGTSDSVPARLSDGEFVLTAKAMRGAGGGDRDVGAARMYDMMSQLEGAA